MYLPLSDAWIWKPFHSQHIWIFEEAQTHHGKSCVVEGGTRLQNAFCRPCKSEIKKAPNLVYLSYEGRNALWTDVFNIRLLWNSFKLETFPCPNSYCKL